MNDVEWRRAHLGVHVEAAFGFLSLTNVQTLYTNWDLTYTTRQDSRVSCVAQTGFAAFGKGVQLISGSPYAETEQLSDTPISRWAVTIWVDEDSCS